jgi:hypothetical protein
VTEAYYPKAPKPWLTARTEARDPAPPLGSPSINLAELDVVSPQSLLNVLIAPYPLLLLSDSGPDEEARLDWLRFLLVFWTLDFEGALGGVLENDITGFGNRWAFEKDPSALERYRS